MGNASIPASTDEFSNAILVDDGTSARTQSPTPGPIGLDAKSGNPKQTQASMADQIVSFPRQRMAQQVGDGQCFALADRALRNAGAKSAGDFGTVVPDADYVWGTQINLSDVRPGDIIQLRDYRYDREIETRSPDGSSATNTDFQTRPHHTAVVERVDGNGAMTVLEQNAPEGSPVTRHQLFFSDSTTSSGNRTTTITVQGTFWFYRPQAR